MSLASEIISRLSSQGVGSTGSFGSSWRLVQREFVGGTLASSSQAQQICVRQSGGYQQEERINLSNPTFQVLVRAGDSSTGLEAKVDEVITALNKFEGRLPSGSTANTHYNDIQKIGDANYLGRDEQRRPMYSINFEAWRAA